MLASKPCFSTSYSSDTRFIFIVKVSPKIGRKSTLKYVSIFLNQHKIVLRFSKSYYNFSRMGSANPGPKIVLRFSRSYYDFDSFPNFKFRVTFNTYDYLFLSLRLWGSDWESNNSFWREVVVRDISWNGITFLWAKMRVE